MQGRRTTGTGYDVGTDTDHGDGDGPDYDNDTGLDGDADIGTVSGYGFDNDSGFGYGFDNDSGTGFDCGIGYGIGSGTVPGNDDGSDYGSGIDDGTDSDTVAGNGYGFASGNGSDDGIDDGFDSDTVPGNDYDSDDGVGSGNGLDHGDGAGSGDGFDDDIDFGSGIDDGFDSDTVPGNDYDSDTAPGDGPGDGHGDGHGTVSFTQKGLRLMETVTIHFTLFFAKGYIADPYFPEREELINIQKLSGMNRARTEAKREQALKEYLRRQEMSQDTYEALEKRALRPWYRDADTHIIIPSHQFYGCLIEGGKTLSASQRPCDPDNLRHILQLSDWATGKDKEDGIYERLVMPKSGTGQPLSNQRALRKNPFIAQFHATGTIGFFLSDIPDAQRITDFVSYCGQRVGVGASRKMGYGRYTITEHQVT